MIPFTDRWHRMGQFPSQLLLVNMSYFFLPCVDSEGQLIQYKAWTLVVEEFSCRSPQIRSWGLLKISLMRPITEPKIRRSRLSINSPVTTYDNVRTYTVERWAIDRLLWVFVASNERDHDNSTKTTRGLRRLSPLSSTSSSSWTPVEEKRRSRKIEKTSKFER